MTADDDTLVYLDALFGAARPSSLIEVRWRAESGMRRRFVPVADRAAVAEMLLALGRARDVYVGVLPRWRPGGGRADVVGDGRTVWVDLDRADGLRALEPVDPASALVIASGAPGHVHAYWRLRRAVPPREIERANARLAFALHGDERAVDAARILRPPGTVNHKRGRPVRLLDATNRVTGLGELVGGLADPPSWKPVRSRRRRRAGVPRGVEAVAPAVYVERLTGQSVGRSRKVTCPLHEDGTPSLHVYPEAERGWRCFGCGRGGTVFDLAAALWGRELRGRAFAALRADLHALLMT